MATFNMLVGIAGSGKSFYVKQNCFDDDVVISSDAIRAEKGYAPDYVGDVFSTMLARTIEALNEDKDVWYDATNLNRKRRRGLLDQLKQKFESTVEYVCHVILTPLPIIQEQNQNRDVKVPENVISNMIQSFQIPMIIEGWDDIYYIRREKYAPRFSFSDMKNFDQDNPHHRLSLSGHCVRCEEIMMNQCHSLSSYDALILIEAARYHDFGKLITKTYWNKRGQKTEEAHYYGHDCAGAYLYLTEIAPYNDDFNFSLEVATLIEWHMRPYLVWDRPECVKATQKDKDFLGQVLFDYICLLHQADIQAH